MFTLEYKPKFNELKQKAAELLVNMLKDYYKSTYNEKIYKNKELLVSFVHFLDNIYENAYCTCWLNEKNELVISFYKVLDNNILNDTECFIKNTEDFIKKHLDNQIEKERIDEKVFIETFKESWTTLSFNTIENIFNKLNYIQLVTYDLLGLFKDKKP